MEYTVEQLYDAIAQAETGTFNDPWIRTVANLAPGGSTAYGPVQMTGGGGREGAKPSMMYNVYHNPELMGNIGITEQEREYMAEFMTQAESFLVHGNEVGMEGYDPTFDYGGAGTLTSDEDKVLYESIAKKFMAYEYQRTGKDLDKFIESWRGKGEFDTTDKEGRVIKGDKPYYGKIRDALDESLPKPGEGSGGTGGAAAGLNEIKAESKVFSHLLSIDNKNIEDMG